MSKTTFRIHGINDHDHLVSRR